jgi:hypothetical protein
MKQNSGKLGQEFSKWQYTSGTTFWYYRIMTLLSVVIAAIIASYLVDPAIVNWRMIDISIIAFGGIGVLTGIAKGSSIEPKNLFELIQDSPHAPLRSAILWAKSLPTLVLQNATEWATTVSDKLSTIPPQGLPEIKPDIVPPLPESAHHHYNEYLRTQVVNLIVHYDEERQRILRMKKHIETMGEIETILIIIAPYLISVAIALAVFKALNKP